MKRGLVLLVFDALLFAACVGAGAVELWLAAAWWRGERTGDGVTHLTIEARAAYFRHLAVVLAVAGLWSIVGALAVIRLGLVHSAYAAVLSVAAAVAVCGFHWVRKRYNVNAA